MRRFLPAILTILALCEAAPAAEPEVPEFKAIAQQTKSAREAWEGCMAAYAKGRIGASKVPAAEIAEKALAACTARERRVRDALASHIGAQRADNVIAALREMHKTNLAAAIEQIRRKRETE